MIITKSRRKTLESSSTSSGAELHQAATWLFCASVVTAGEEQNQEALQDAAEETQWDWTTQDKPSSSSSLISLLPALAPVPSHSFQLGLYCSPHSLYLFLHFFPSVSPLLLVCTSSPDPPGARSGLHFNSPGVPPYFWRLILQACTL